MKKWTKKPPVGVEIDYTNSLTVGLTQVWLFNEGHGTPKNLIPGGLELENGNGAGSDECTWGIDSYGMHMAASTGAARLRTTVNVNPSTDWPQGTIVAAFKATTLTMPNNYRFYGSHDDFEARVDTPDSVIQVDKLCNGTPGQKVISNNEFFIHSSSWGPRPASENGNHNWINGYFDEGNDSAARTTTANRFAILSREDNLSQGFVGNVYFFFQWDREITRGEHQALGQDPWQIFKPLKFMLTEVPDDSRFGSLPRPWTVQPPYDTPIDKNNPFRKNLTYVKNFSNLTLPDPITRTAQTVNNFVLAKDYNTKYGVHSYMYTDQYTAGASGDYWRSFYGPSLSGSNKTFSVSVLFYTAEGDDGTIVSQRDPTTTLTNFHIIDNVDSWQWGFGGGLTTIELSNKGLDDGTWHVMTLSRIQGGRAMISLDGTIRKDTTITDTGNASVDGTSISVGHRWDTEPGTGFGMSYAGFALLMFWEDRFLTEGEHIQLAQNPWQIFEPPKTYVILDEELPKLAKIKVPY